MWRGGLQGRQRAREVAHWLGPLIAARLMFGQRVVQRTAPGPAIVECLSECARIEERVTDPLRGNRIPVVTGGAARRRTGAERLTKIVGPAGRPDPLLFPGRNP